MTEFEDDQRLHEMAIGIAGRGPFCKPTWNFDFQDFGVGKAILSLEVREEFNRITESSTVA